MTRFTRRQWCLHMAFFWKCWTVIKRRTPLAIAFILLWFLMARYLDAFTEFQLQQHFLLWCPSATYDGSGFAFTYSIEGYAKAFVHVFKPGVLERYLMQKLIMSLFEAISCRLNLLHSSRRSRCLQSQCQSACAAGFWQLWCLKVLFNTFSCLLKAGSLHAN